MSLSIASNFPDPDAAYRMIVEAHRDLDDEQSAVLDTALVLVLANHIGDIAILREAITLAKRQSMHQTKSVNQTASKDTA